MQPLKDILLRPIADTPRTRDYMRRIDDSLARTMPRFDIDRGLLVPRGKPPAFDEGELLSWDRERRMAVSREPEWTAYYDQSRASAAVLGCMAFCYAQPMSRFHADPRLLTAVRNGLRTYAQRQAASGEFVFCPVRYATIWGTHETAWRLEPLIYACVWLGDALPAEDREAARAMLRRASEFLLAHPNDEFCNRGCVWSAITALAGRFLGEARFLEAAARNWRRLRGIIDPKGAVLENRGPDSNYSYTGVSYIYLYRIFSGDAALDEPLIRALKWFACLRTNSAYPFEGMSSRCRHVLGHALGDLLALLERFAPQQPFFVELIDRYLAHLDRHDLDRPGHACDMRIWAMMEHNPAVQAPEDEPAWFAGYSLHLRSDCVLYSLVKRRYQTAVTHFAFQPLHGMQTWALDDEPPILHPGRMTASGTEAHGIDTAAFPLSARSNDAQTPDWSWQEGPPAVLSGRQKALWTHYIFTPASTVVLLAGDTGPRTTAWCVNRAATPEPRVERDAVIFPGLRGRLCFLGEPPETDAATEAGVVRLVFQRHERWSVFAFSNEEFRFGHVDPDAGRLSFADADGAWEVRVTVAGERQRIDAGLRTRAT